MCMSSIYSGWVFDIYKEVKMIVKEKYNNNITEKLNLKKIKLINYE